MTQHTDRSRQSSEKQSVPVPSQWLVGDWRHAKWCLWERGSETECNCGLDAFRRSVNAARAEPTR